MTALRWTPLYEDSPTVYGYATLSSGRTLAVAVYRRERDGYRWGLVAPVSTTIEGIERDRDEAERKAEAAYRHARGLLGSVTP